MLWLQSKSRYRSRICLAPVFSDFIFDKNAIFARSSYQPTPMPTRAEELTDFIQNIEATTGKSLQEWYALAASSSLTNFLDIRLYLQTIHGLDTHPATNIAMLYHEHLETTTPRIYVSNEGRGGSIAYRGPDGGFTMDFELGGGDALALVFVPAAAYWEAQTGIPPDRRDAVLANIGQLLLEQQAGGRGSYEVQDNCLVIF